VSAATWGHDALAEDLARHLRCAKTMVWQNVQLGPSGSPRPDVYTIDRSFAHPHPRAYEAKVSRADFLADVTTGKWRTYLKFADSVVFAVPAGLVAPAEVPPLAGLIVRGDAGWRTLRRAVPGVVSIPEDALLKLLIDGIEREGCRHRTRAYADAMAGVDRFCQKFGKDAAAWVARRQEAEDAVRNAEYQAERILDDAKRAAERDRKEVERVAPEQWRKLCDVFGLETNASTWTVRDAVHKATATAAGWAQPPALTELRQSLARALQRADDLIEATKPKPDATAAPLALAAAGGERLGI